MSCDLHETAIMEYLDGELTLSEEEKLKAHLQICASCRELLSTQKKQQAMLRALPLFAPGEDFTNRVMKEIHRKKDALNLKRLLFFLLMPTVLGITVFYIWWPQVVLGVSFITVYAVNGIKMLITVTNNLMETAFHWLGIGEKIAYGLWWAQKIIFKVILEIFNWHFLGFFAVVLMFGGTLFLAKILPQHKQS